MKLINPHEVPNTSVENVVNELEFCLKRAEKFFDKKFILDQLRFDLKGKAAGQFVVKKTVATEVRALRVNSFLLHRYKNEYIEQVIGHEVAHLIIYTLKKEGEFGRKKILPHGKEWKFVMSKVLGKQASIRHQFETESRQVSVFRYRCECNELEHKLSAIRHNRILRNKARYLCKKCDSLLIYEP